VWGDTALPWVSSYKYLGVLFSSTGTFAAHIAAKLEKGAAASHTHRAITHNSRVAFSLRKLALQAVVLPVVLWAAEVWHVPSPARCRQLDSWQMHVVTDMMHCPHTASHACLQNELGILPLHVLCDQRMLAFVYRLHRAPPASLLHCVFCACRAPDHPWYSAVQRLTSAYAVDWDLAQALSPPRFARYLAGCVEARLRALWCPRPPSAAVAAYRAAFQPHLVPPAMAQPYHALLRHRGAAAELLLQLRVHCLPLRSFTARFAASSSTSALSAALQQCPCCSAPCETVSHFLFDCLGYAAHRALLWQSLASVAPHHLAVFRALPPPLLPLAGVPAAACPPDARIPAFLSPEFWDASPSPSHPFHHVATFLLASWRQRSLALAALAGRVAQGGDP
jgi:hypothetical protein